jgi:trans-aconitate methyltransferase
MSPSDARHWSRVWSTKQPDEVSWYEEVPASSLAMVEQLDLPADAPVLDLGGGASGLAGELLRRGFTDVTVADISAAGLAAAKRNLGERSAAVRWVEADVRSHDFGRRFALWHDRAVFHFMTDEADRSAYLATLRESLEPGGHVIVATFGPQGPPTCSDLPVHRYGADELAAAFAPVAGLVASHLEDHRTPGGNVQQFLYAHLEAR